MPSDLSFLTSLIATTVFLSAPIAYAFLGVMWSELSGVFVFGIEGMMLLGAIAGFLGTLASGNSMIGLLIGLATGLILGLMSAFFEVSLGSDQIIFAIALLVIGPSLSSYIYGIYTAGRGLSPFAVSITTFPPVPIPFLSQLPIIGPFFDQPWIVYLMYFLLVGPQIFLYRTNWGLRIRAVGMNPLAADSMGADVYRIRYAALALSGMFAALGGMTLIMAQTGFWTNNVTAGRGLIAIALVRVGNWRIQLTYAATLVVSALIALGATLQQYYSSAGTQSSALIGSAFPYEVFNSLPYIFAVAVIAISYKWTRSNEPASIGRHYKRE